MRRIMNRETLILIQKQVSYSKALCNVGASHEVRGEICIWDIQKVTPLCMDLH